MQKSAPNLVGENLVWWKWPTWADLECNWLFIKSGVSPKSFGGVYITMFSLLSAWGDTNLLCTLEQHLVLTGSNTFVLQEWWNSIISNHKSQFCRLSVSPINSAVIHRLTCNGQFHLLDVPLVGRFQALSNVIFLCPSPSERSHFSQISRTKKPLWLWSFASWLKKKIIPRISGKLKLSGRYTIKICKINGLQREKGFLKTVQMIWSTGDVIKVHMINEGRWTFFLG